MSHEIVNPAEWGRPSGWNSGMLAPEGGRVLFVAGQIGVGGEGGAEAGRGAAGAGAAGTVLAVQFRAALANVAAVVEAAGGRIADVGRLTIYVTDMEAYRKSPAEMGTAYRAVFGKHFPAMALVAVTELVDPRAVVEVEATAVIPQARPGGHSATRPHTAKEQP
ncbi:MAG: RidA family protein [Gemmatimonadota bacterium]|nr:RidA family protein [Gemmatimonadota bacterium]